MKIVELKIDDNDFSGVDAVALVESPAIEMDFIAFNKVKMAEMTFDDYPKKAVENAKRGIEINKELGNKCATQVGKVRAQQLANGEKLSLDTIQRMRSFLIRQKGNYELAVRRKDYEACGYISYLLWGGEEALPWAEKKLRQAGIEFSTKFGDTLLPSNIPQMPTNEPQNFVDSAGGFRVGDYVSWTFAGRQDDADRGRGQIKDIRVEGEVKIPDSDFVFKPSKERPLALIETRSGRIVGQYIDNLRKIQKPEGFDDILEEIIKDYIIAELLGLDDDDFDINVNALPNYVNEASSGKKKELFAALQEKQMLVGPLMTPGKLIPRLDEATGEEYQVFFTKETIEKIAYKMMQDKLIDSVNIEHDNNKKQNDVYLVETWIVTDPENDKSNSYGFKPVEGEWYGMYKIDNKPLWQDYVKTGKVKGFSVEGYFYNNLLTKK